MIMMSRIARRNDDPTSYAMEESSKRVGKGTPFAISCLGEKDQVEHVTREDVRQAYEDIMNHTTIDMFVIGSVDPVEVKCVIEETLPFAPRSEKYSVFYSWPKDYETQNHEVQRDIDQSNLVLTWLTNINLTHPLFYALKVANGIFGGDANSKLFRVVREKHSLCYTIYSSVYGLDQVMIGLAGISYENKEKALSLIEEQFEKVKQGDFQDEDMETSKRLYVNSLQSQFDSASGMVNFLYQQKVTGLDRSLEEVIENISHVSKEDVIAAMSQVTLAGVFVLKERDGAQDENDDE